MPAKPSYKTHPWHFEDDHLNQRVSDIVIPILVDTDLDVRKAGEKLAKELKSRPSALLDFAMWVAREHLHEAGKEIEVQEKAANRNDANILPLSKAVRVSGHIRKIEPVRSAATFPKIKIDPKAIKATAVKEALKLTAPQLFVRGFLVDGQPILECKAADVLRAADIEKSGREMIIEKSTNRENIMRALAHGLPPNAAVGEHWSLSDAAAQIVRLGYFKG